MCFMRLKDLSWLAHNFISGFSIMATILVIVSILAYLGVYDMGPV